MKIINCADFKYVKDYNKEIGWEFFVIENQRESKGWEPYKIVLHNGTVYAARIHDLLGDMELHRAIMNTDKSFKDWAQVSKEFSNFDEMRLFILQRDSKLGQLIL